MVDIRNPHRKWKIPRDASSKDDILSSPQDNIYNVLSPASNLTSTFPQNPAMPFTAGLTGVNVPLDTTTTRALWGSLLGFFLTIIVVRLLLRANAYLRHVTSLTEKEGSQRYWSENNGWIWSDIKRNLLYAPLVKKRHNRELQLSKAFNMGTLPSRFHTILLLVYLASNIAYSCLLSYGEARSALLAEIRGRTGHLATINMGVLLVFAGRNNPLISLMRVPFDTFNLFHRWIGRLIVLETLAHVAAWAVNLNYAEGSAGIVGAIKTSTFIQYGLLATIAMVIILFQSPSAIRHAAYETFLHIHRALAIAAILGVWVHSVQGNLPQIRYVRWVIAIWASDRVMRWVRIIYRNVSLNGCTTVTVEALHGEACRVTFKLARPWAHKPGCHVYVYLPRISLWMSHPFSVAWSDTSAYEGTEMKEVKPTTPQLEVGMPGHQSTSISLIVSKHSGMTAKLYDKAKSSPTGVIELTGFAEGPYGGLESLHSYGTALLFAGGVGITHQLGYVRDLLAGADARTTATRKITLCWSVRTTEQLTWVQPWMDEILNMPSRRQYLQIYIFVSKPRSARDIVSPSARVQMFPGRANPRVLVEKEMQNRVGAMAVTVCGPGALADDVRDSCRRVVGQGVIDFIEESFTW